MSWSTIRSDSGEKWRNLGKRQLADVVPPGELFGWLEGRKLDAVIHLGAISDTTATDGDLVIETNFRLSLRLLEWCTTTRIPRSSMRPRPRPMGMGRKVSATTGRRRRCGGCDP